MKILIKFKKSISIITASCLFLSFVIGPTAANAMTNEEATAKYKQIFKDFMLPYSYGQITSAHFAGTDRVIINIQDLHCHPKVQRNISNIIEIFDKSFGVKNVYLEGVYGHLSTKWVTDKIDNIKKTEILNKMLETGRLTGAEYYSAVSGKTEIINGLEEKEPYLENLKRFGDIVGNQEKINLILNAMDESLSEIKQQYYTKRQHKLEELSKNYIEGKITPQKYYALLSKHIEKLGIDLSKYENTFTYITLLELQKNLDYSKITNELQNLILLLRENLANSAYQMLVDNTENFSKMDKLYGYIVRISRELGLDLTVNFPNLDNYFGYIELSQKINPLELIDEEKRLTEEINTRFSETKAQREVVFLTNFRKYLGDYVTSKITSDDYDYYKENIDTYRQLWNKYVDNKVLSLLDEYILEADKFYKINTDRNIYFTRNMFHEGEELNKIENEVEAKGDVNKIIENMKGVKEVDVVITGGFHSQTVTDILKNHGVSYIVITPNVTDGTKLAEETYYQIAKEQSKISFQALATLPFSAYPEELRIRAAVGAFGADIAKALFPDKIAIIDSVNTKPLDDDEKAIAQEMKKLRRQIEESKFLESDDTDFVKFLEKISGENVDIKLSEYVDLDDLDEILTNKEVSSIKNVLKNAEKDMYSGETGRAFRQETRKIRRILKKITKKFTSQIKYSQKQDLIRKINAVNLSFLDVNLLKNTRGEYQPLIDEIKERFEGRRLESLSLKDLEDYWELKKKILNIYEIKDANAVKELVGEMFADIEAFFSLIGYSDSPENYSDITLSILSPLMEKMSEKIGKGRFGILSSPTASKGSIDATSTMLAQMYDALMLYVTATGYLKYVETDKFPKANEFQKYFDKVKKEELTKNGTNLREFLTAFKFVAETGDIYSQAVANTNNTDSSNIAIIIGGRAVSIEDLINAVIAENEIFLISSEKLSQQTPVIIEKKGNFIINNSVEFVLFLIKLIEEGFITKDGTFADKNFIEKNSNKLSPEEREFYNFMQAENFKDKDTVNKLIKLFIAKKITKKDDLQEIKINVLFMEDKDADKKAIKNKGKEIADRIWSILEQKSFFKEALTYSKIKTNGKVTSIRREVTVFDLSSKEYLDKYCDYFDDVPGERPYYKLKDKYNHGGYYSNKIYEADPNYPSDKSRTDGISIDPIFVIYGENNVGFMPRETFENVYEMDSKTRSGVFSAVKKETEVEVCFVEPRTIIQTTEGRVTVHSNEIVIKKDDSIYAMPISSFERLYPSSKAENKKFYEQYEKEIKRLEKAQEKLSGTKTETTAKQTLEEQAKEQSTTKESVEQPITEALKRGDTEKVEHFEVQVDTGKNQKQKNAVFQKLIDFLGINEIENNSEILQKYNLKIGNNKNILAADINFILENKELFEKQFFDSKLIDVESVEFFLETINLLRETGYDIDIEIYMQIIWLIKPLALSIGNFELVPTVEKEDTKNLILKFFNLNATNRQKLYDLIKDRNHIPNTFSLMVNAVADYENGMCSEEEIDYILKILFGNIITFDIKGNYFSYFKNKSININNLRFYLEQKNKFSLEPPFSLWLSLIYSDIDVDTLLNKDHVKNEDLIGLMDILRKQSIRILDTEYNGLTLKILLNRNFRKYIAMQYRMEKKENSVLARYRTAQKIARALYYNMGDNVLNLSEENLNIMIAKLIRNYSETKKYAGQTDIVSEKTGVVVIHNKEENKGGTRRFTLRGVEEVMNLLGVTPKLKMNLIIENNDDIKDKADRWLGSIENFLDLLEENGLTNIRYIFNGHGGEDGLFLLGDGMDEQIGAIMGDLFTHMTDEQVANALFRAYQKCLDRGKGELFEKLILDLSCCNSYVFAKKVIARLEQLEQAAKLEQENGLTLIRLPQIITEAGKETKYGYTVKEKEEEFQLGNMEYSLIEYIKEKKIKGKLTLEDLFDAEIYSSNHTIFVSGGRIQEVNEDLRKYISETLGEDFIFKDEQQQGEVGSDYSLPMRTSELTTEKNKQKLARRGIDEFSEKGQRIINRRENWRIVFGIFFEGIRDSFIKEHEGQDYEQVSQNLDYVIAHSGDIFNSVVQNIPSNRIVKFFMAISILLNPIAMRSLAKAHSDWNKKIQQQQEQTDQQTKRQQQRSTTQQTQNRGKEITKVDEQIDVEPIYWNIIQKFMDIGYVDEEELDLIKEYIPFVGKEGGENYKKYSSMIDKINKAGKDADKISLLANVQVITSLYQYVNEDFSLFEQILKRNISYELLDLLKRNFDIKFLMSLSDDLFHTLWNNKNISADKMEKFVSLLEKNNIEYSNDNKDLKIDVLIEYCFNNLDVSEKELKEMLELADDLSKRKIPFISFENDRLALKIYINERFNKLIEKELSKYLDINSIGVRYDIALDISREIARTIGKIDNSNFVNIDEMIEMVIKERYLPNIRFAERKSIIGPKTNFISLFAETKAPSTVKEDFGLDMENFFEPASIRYLLSALGLNPDKPNYRYIERTQDENAKQHFFEQIASIDKDSEDTYLFVFMHGKTKELIVLGDEREIKETISVEEFADALYKLYEKGVDLSKITIDLSACASYYYGLNLYENLYNRGVRQLPNIWTTAGFETPLGVGTQIKETIGTNSLAALVNYVEKNNKTDLTALDFFKARSEVTSSNATLFLSGTDFVDAKYRKKLIDLSKDKSDFIPGNKFERQKGIFETMSYKDFVNLEFFDIPTLPEGVSELTTIPTKGILKILGLDENSKFGQTERGKKIRKQIISFLEDWQIMLGIFFPGVKRNFIRMHGKKNEKNVEKGLDEMLTALGRINADVTDALKFALDMNFIEKIMGFSTLILRRYTREEFSDIHEKLNTGELAKEEEERIKEQERTKKQLENAINQANNKDYFIELLNNFSKYNNEQKDKIVSKIVNFIKNESDKNSKIELFNSLLSKIDYIKNPSSKNLIFEEFMNEFKNDNSLSEDEKFNLLNNFVNHIEKFNLEQKQRDDLFDECFKFIEKDENKSDKIIKNILTNILFFGTDRTNRLIDILFEKNMFDTKKGQNYIFPILVQLDLLDTKYRDRILAISIDFLEDYSEVFVQLLKQKKYLNSTQQKQLFDKINRYVSNTNQLSTSSILEILEALSYEEFADLNNELRNNIVNSAIRKLEFKNKIMNIEGERDRIKLLRSILSKKYLLNNEQKRNLRDILFDNIFKIGKENRVAFIENFYEIIDWFSNEQKTIIQKTLNGLKIFSSSKIGNNNYTQLISKIRSVSDRVREEYKFFDILSTQTDTARGIEVFQNYKQLETENLKTLKLLMNLSSKTDLKNIRQALEKMFDYYEKIAINKDEIEKFKKNCIDKFFEQDNIDIEKQRDLHGYDINTILEADLADITINDLINVIHQTSIRDFKINMNLFNSRKKIEGLFVQNFSKDGYVNPDIEKLLSKVLAIGQGMVCFDEETLVISIKPIDKHSTTIVVNTDNINKGLTFSLYDGIEYRDISTERILKELGFETELKLPLVSAKLDKNIGLTEDTDLVEKFDLLLKAFYLTTRSDENNYYMYGLEDYTNKYGIAIDNGLYDKNDSKDLYALVNAFYRSVRENKIFNTKENLDRILRDLDLPEIPEDESVLYIEPQTGIKIVGQIGINKYFNAVIDRAFSEGMIIIDKNGNLVKNSDYDSMKNIEKLLNEINTSENEILRQASFIDELNKQNGQLLKLETKAKIGQLEYQTGYLQLSTGDYLFVKVLKNPVNGMIRYAQTEFVTQTGKREFLKNSNELLKIIKKEGYKIHENPRKKSDGERETFKKELKGAEERTENISVSGRLMGGEKTSVVGRVVFDSDSKNFVEGESILFKEYLSPDDMQGTLNAKGIVLTSGMELSHQGLIVKEKGILATIISGVKFIERNGKKFVEIKYMEMINAVPNIINGFTVKEVVEKTITVNEGDEIAIDGKTGRVIVFDKSVVTGTSRDENKKREYKDYKTEENMSKLEKKSVIREEKQPVESHEIGENVENNIEAYIRSFYETQFEDYVKGFNEDANKKYFGTKSTNLQAMSKMGVEVPFGIMIGDGAFLSILFRKGDFKKEYIEYVKAVRNKDIGLAQKQAKKILEIIEKSKQELSKEFAKIIDEKLKRANMKKTDKYAVRSTFKNEDGTEFSAAGVGESKVGVAKDEIVNALMDVLDSAFSERSVAYQCSTGKELVPSALIQKAVNSQKSAVMLLKGNRITISGSWGLGEIVVSGEKIQSTIEIEIDENIDFERLDYAEILKYIQKNPDCIKILNYVTERQDYGYGLNGEIIKISEEDSTRELFSEDDIQKMVRDAIYLRKQYGYDPDIELAFDEENVLNILQIRPITEKKEGKKEKIIEEQENITTSKETALPVEQIYQQGQETQTTQQQEKSEEIQVKSVMDFATKMGMNPTELVNLTVDALIEELFSTDSRMKGKNIILEDGMITDDKLAALKEVADAQGINIVILKISNVEDKDTRGGKVIDEENKIRMLFNSATNELIIYSKQGISLSVEAIKELIEIAYSEGRKDLNFTEEQIIAFAEKNDTTIDAIQNRIRNAAINGIQRAEVEVSLDLSDMENIVSIENKCKGMSSTTIIINAEQLDKCGAEINDLRKEGFRFLLRGNIGVIDTAFKGDILLDGAILEGATEKDLEDLEDLAANNTKGTLHIETQMYVNMATAKGIDANKIYDDNGIIPIVNIKQTQDMIGKYAIGYNEDMTDEDINNMLSTGRLVNILCNDKEGTKLENLRTRLANIFKNMFGTMNELLKPKSPEQRISEETSAVSDYNYGEEFEKEIANIKEKILKGLKDKNNIIRRILTTEVAEDEDARQLVDELKKSEIYKQLPSVIQMRIETEILRNNYFEVLGTVRGTVNKIIDQAILNQWNNENANKKYWEKEYKEYRQYIRIRAIQLIMSGQDLDKLLELRPDTNQTVEELFETIKTELNKDVRKTITANKTAIKEIETKEEIENAQTNLKNINALLEDSLLKIGTAKQLEIPVIAVRSILAAA